MVIYRMVFLPDYVIILYLWWFTFLYLTTIISFHIVLFGVWLLLVSNLISTSKNKLEIKFPPPECTIYSITAIYGTIRGYINMHTGSVVHAVLLQ